MSVAPAMGRLPLVVMLRFHGLALIAGKAPVVAPRRGAVLRMSSRLHRLVVAWQAGVLTSVMRALITWLMGPLPLLPTP